MGWTLDRESFNRLVGLYLISVVLELVAATYEAIGPGWDVFSSEFDSLVEKHFGVMDDITLIIFGAVLLMCLLWHFISLIGLKKFKPWARWGFWVSMALATLVASIPGLAMPSFVGPLGSLTGFIAIGLFGAIVLLAYSRDHGGMWFKGHLETLKEIF